MPVATNCWVLPAATDGLAGVTAMETSVAGVTVNVVLPLIPSFVAVIVVDPADWLVDSPVLVFIVAFDVSELVQVTSVVRLAVELSE